MSAHATGARSAGRERPALNPLPAAFVCSLPAPGAAQVTRSIEAASVPGISCKREALEKNALETGPPATIGAADE